MRCAQLYPGIWMYENGKDDCLHRDCKHKGTCNYLQRTRTSAVVTGALLGNWKKVEQIVGSAGNQQTFRIVRITTDDASRLVGIHVPATQYRKALGLAQSLTADAAPSCTDSTAAAVNSAAAATTTPASPAKKKPPTKISKEEDIPALSLLIDVEDKDICKQARYKAPMQKAPDPVGPFSSAEEFAAGEQRMNADSPPRSTRSSAKKQFENVEEIMNSGAKPPKMASLFEQTKNKSKRGRSKVVTAASAKPSQSLRSSVKLAKPSERQVRPKITNARWMVESGSEASDDDDFVQNRRRGRPPAQAEPSSEEDDSDNDQVMMDWGDINGSLTELDDDEEEAPRMEEEEEEEDPGDAVAAPTPSSAATALAAAPAVATAVAVSDEDVVSEDEKDHAAKGSMVNEVAEASEAMELSERVASSGAVLEEDEHIHVDSPLATSPRSPPVRPLPKDMLRGGNRFYLKQTHGGPTTGEPLELPISKDVTHIGRLKHSMFLRRGPFLPEARSKNLVTKMLVDTQLKLGPTVSIGRNPDVDADTAIVLQANVIKRMATSTHFVPYFAHIYHLYATRHPPFDVLYFVPMLIECYWCL